MRIRYFTHIFYTISIIFFTVSCGIKTDLFLEPPFYLPSTAIDSTSFRHVQQINETTFRGYYIFYKIFDYNDDNIYDFTDLEDGGEVDQFITNFKASGALSLSNLDSMINTEIHNLSPTGRYGYLKTIGNTEIINNDVEYVFTIKSSKGITLDAESDLLFSNDTLDPGNSEVLLRHFNDELDNPRLQPFGLNDLDNEDADLPSIENPGGTIDFDEVTVDYSLLIAFIGVAYGEDVSNLASKILSEPEFLGTIRLEK